MLRIAIVLPSNPIGYDKVRCCRNKEQREIFVMGILRQPVQALTTRGQRDLRLFKEEHTGMPVRGRKALSKTA